MDIWPPVTRTFPHIVLQRVSSSRVAVCEKRGAAMRAVSLHVPVAGLNISADAKMTLVQ